MSKLLLTNILADKTDISLRALHIIDLALGFEGLRDITLGDLINNRDIIFGHSYCSSNTHRELMEIINEYLNS